MLEVTVNDELFGLPDELDLREEEALAARGALGRSARRELFVAVVRSVVLPGLARFGVDAGPGDRWLEERVGRSEASSCA